MSALPLIGLFLGIAIGLLIAAQRFSIRTALVATALVAAALGLLAITFAE